MCKSCDVSGGGWRLKWIKYNTPACRGGGLEGGSRKGGREDCLTKSKKKSCRGGQGRGFEDMQIVYRRL